MAFITLRRLASATALATLPLTGLALPALADDVLVFAAASLQGPLDEIATAWGAETGHTVTISYAGSSALARQIEAGAPSDIFISASVDWMDTLATGGQIDLVSRRDILGNTLVLVAHGEGAPAVTIDASLDLMGLLNGERLAMALVDSVPAGVYGKAALTYLGLWDAVEPSVAQSDNVRSTLALVAQGEAPFGIVYATDAAADAGVTTVGTFPAESHEPIIYPAALVTESTSDVAGDFLTYLGSEAARPVWVAAGFTVIE